MIKLNPAAALIIKSFLAVILIVLVFYAVDFQAVAREFKTLSWPLFLVVVAGHFILMIVKAYRWQLLCKQAGIRVPYLHAVKAYTTAVAFGTFTPGQLGDLGKVFLLHLPKDGYKSVLASTVIDRLWDVIGLLLAAFLSALYLYHVNARFFPVIFASSIILAVGGIAGWLFHRPIFSMIRKRWQIDIHSLFTASRPALLLTLLTIIIQFFRWMILGAALGKPLLLSGTAATIGTFIALLPISIAGLGTREAAIGYIFKLNGLLAGTGVALSLLMFTTYLIGALVGAVLLLFHPHHPPGADEASRNK